MNEDNATEMQEMLALIEQWNHNFQIHEAQMSNLRDMVGALIVLHPDQDAVKKEFEKRIEHGIARLLDSTHSHMFSAQTAEKVAHLRKEDARNFLRFFSTPSTQ